MDRRYSYTPNSRSARRMRERKRKKRRNRRIVVTIVVLLAICAGGFGAVKVFRGSLPEFDPITGLTRLASSIKQTADTQPESEPTAQPEQTEEPEAQPEAEEVYGTDYHDSELLSNVGVYPAAGEMNDLLTIFKTAEGEEEKICCLTFDDGPNSVTTPQILDTLAKYNVKATFFELGEKLEANRELAKRTYDEGHLLVNHTYTQKYSTIYKSWDSFFGEIQKTEALILEITGEEPFKLVRFPGGSFNSGVYGTVKQDFKAKLAQNGYYFIDWNAENGDDGSRNASQIADYVKNNYGSKPMVMLMEDSAARRATAQSLAQVIEYLQSRGYVFKRLDELCYYTMENMPVNIVNTAAPDGYFIFEKRGCF